MFRPLEAIIRSRSGYPKVGEKFGWQRCRKGVIGGPRSRSYMYGIVIYNY